MPTGYTADVQDGTITRLDDFAWQCARAMGALMMMRDAPMKAPIPDRFEPETDYYDKALTAAQDRLAELTAMTPAAAREAAQQAYAEEVRADDAYRAKKDTGRARYEAMLAKVRKWTPPTTDHSGFKDFMIKQLTESIRFDCSPSGFMHQPTKLEPDVWLSQEIAKARRDIAYHTDERAKEVARTESRNTWIARLRQSLALAEA